MSISFPDPLTPEEEKYYIQRWEAGDETAKDILIERNLRLVAHIARKYTGPQVPSDDLISIGTIGLIKAVSTYNSSKASRLAAYAARCIENEILMSLRATKRVRTEFSLSDPIGTDSDGNEIRLDDVLGTDPDDILNSISLKMQIHKLLESLDEVLTCREKEVIISRYGLAGAVPRTQREVAASLGISRSYVSRIEKKAMEKLKEALKDEKAEEP